MLDAFNENAENDAYKAYYANKKRAVKQTTRLMMLAFECAFVRCNL